MRTGLETAGGAPMSVAAENAFGVRRDGTVERHPLDPEPVASTKSRTVLALGVVALLTGPFVGGAVPAVLALLLSREARRQAYTAGGFLTGTARLRLGERLAWAGLVLAVTTLVIAAIVGLVHLAQAPAGRDFDPTID